MAIKHIRSRVYYVWSQQQFRIVATAFNVIRVESGYYKRGFIQAGMACVAGPYLLLVHRFPLERESWRWRIVIFVLAGFAIALARTVVPVVIHFFVIYNSRFLRSYLANKYYDLISDFLVALVVYGLVFTFGQALNYHNCETA